MKMTETVVLMFCCAGVVMGEDGALVLRSERVALALGRATKGAVVSVRSPEGVELAPVAPAAAKPVPLFTLAFVKAGDPAGERRWANSLDASSFEAVRAGGEQDGALTMAYDGFGELPARVVCTARSRPGDAMIRWGITVAVPTGWLLESVEYPRIPLATPLGSGGDDDIAVMGATKGGLYRPATMKVGASHRIGQPGNMAAQFGCYYDDRGGFYTAAEDARGAPKSLALSRSAAGVSLCWHVSCLCGGVYTQAYEVVTGTFAGYGGAPPDWRDAADLYKEWAVKQPWCRTLFAQREDLPAWLKQGPAMVRFGRDWLAGPGRIERWVTEYWKKYFPDAPLVTAYWGWEKHGSWVTPDYFPVYPSDEAFEGLVARTRKLGCHAFPWPSGYHWTLTYDKRADGRFEWDDRARFDAVARPHAVHDRDGALYIRVPSWLRGGETACLCGGDPWTRGWWNEEICLPLAKRGCELIQVDQVVGGNWPACYAADHGHPPGRGAWMTEAFVEQLRSMRQVMRTAEPDAVVCFEEPNEWFNHLVGLQDYRDCECSGEWASVFNYLYHEYLPPFQSNPHRGDRVMAAHCLADGQMPHLVPSGRDLGEPVLVNGGFEPNPPQGNALAGWQQVHAYNGVDWNGLALADTDAGRSRDGNSCLLLKNERETDIVQISQNVYVEDTGFATGRRYRLSAWMNVERMPRGNAINYGLFAPGLKAIEGGRLPFPAAGAGWQRVSSDFTVPAGCEMLRIMIHVNGAAIARVDSVALSELLPGGTAAEARYSGESRETRFMRRWVELYHGEGRLWLQHGKLLHPPRLICATQAYRNRAVPVVFHNAFRAADGSEAVVLANATREPQTVTLFWRGEQPKLVVKADDVLLIK